jgi:hypothetical protein
MGYSRKTLRQEKELIVHRELRPLFHKTEEKLREFAKKTSKNAEEQRRKSRELAGLYHTPTMEAGVGNEGGGHDSEVVIGFGSEKTR